MNLINNNGYPDDEGLNLNLPQARLSIWAQIKFFVKLTKVYAHKKLEVKISSLKLSLAVAVMFLIFLIGISAYAYNTASVTFGSPLFGLKQAIEGAKLALATPGLNKVKIYMQLADRRLAEAKYLSTLADFKTVANYEFIATVYAQNGDDIESNLALVKTIDQVQADNQAAIEQADQITQIDDMINSLSILESAGNKQLAMLTEIAGNVGLKNDAATSSIALALEKNNRQEEAVKKAKKNVEAAKTKGENETEVKIEDGDLAADKADAAVLSIDLASAKDSWQSQVMQFSDYSEIDVNKLVGRVEAKLDQVQEAINSGNLNQAQGLLKAAQALQNNAKHFIKKIENITNKNDNANINLPAENKNQKREKNDRE